MKKLSLVICVVVMMAMVSNVQAYDFCLKLIAPDEVNYADIEAPTGWQVECVGNLIIDNTRFTNFEYRGYGTCQDEYGHSSDSWIDFNHKDWDKCRPK